MKISKIQIPISETSKVRLKEINLTKKPFGSTVALVGKNGAGKSRVLKFVENYAKNINAVKYYDDHITNIPQNILSQFTPNLRAGKTHFEDMKRKNVSPTNINNQMLQYVSTGFLQRYQRFSPAYVKVVDNDDLKIIKNHINNDLNFDNILNNRKFENIISNPNSPHQQKTDDNINLNEFTALNSDSTVNYFIDLSNKIATEEFNLYLKNKNNPLVVNDEIKKNNSFLLFNSFQKYVKEFLGKEFSYQQTANGNMVSSTLHLNDNPFDINLLSPGQKMLFAYAILFFYLDTNSEANIKDSIIIIDEPEKHLHPEAQIKLIDALKNIVGQSGQLWIATHSVHILSHLDFDEILLVKDDEIIPPSRTTPGNSFNELMGLENHISELISFINSISDWAYGNFMVQCFKNPDVVFGSSLDDPQYVLFKEFISNKSNINLLDYGAGKGRIGYTIEEDSSTSGRINYHAFEPDKSNYELLNNVPNIRALYGDVNKIPSDAFDMVILCNVLHEINPNDWIETLNSIKRVLKNEGFLIVIEDRFLPKGETAHEYGYIILGSEETPILLNSKKHVEIKLEESELNNRIIFNAFSKGEINPNIDSVKASLLKLKDNTFNNIKLLKKSPKDLNQGRRLANETQLYINSELYLKSIKTTKKEITE